MSVYVPALADHANDGLHTIRYYAIDYAGNVETGYRVLQRAHHDALARLGAGAAAGGGRLRRARPPPAAAPALARGCLDRRLPGVTQNPAQELTRVGALGLLKEVFGGAGGDHLSPFVAALRGPGR